MNATPRRGPGTVFGPQRLPALEHACECITPWGEPFDETSADDIADEGDAILFAARRDCALCDGKGRRLSPREPFGGDAKRWFSRGSASVAELIDLAHVARLATYGARWGSSAATGAR